MAKRRAANSMITPLDPASAPPARQMSYDWAAPETADITERIARRLSEVASTPNVSGLVLLDDFPPGYSLTSPDLTNPFRLPWHEDFFCVGYNSLARVAFIRSAGFDPIDITSDTFAGSVDLRLPFLEPNVSPSLPDNSAINIIAEWNRYRSDIVSKSLADLYSPLMASLPKSEGGFPVYLQNRGAYSATAGRWFSRWKKKDALPARGSSEQVLDFSEIPVSQALELLERMGSPSAAR